MFHIPESSRVTDGPMGTAPNAGAYGHFVLPSPEPGWRLFLIADSGDLPEADGWEHVSVHARRDRTMRTPTWREMCFVKAAFWDADDVVVQFHPRAADYVNIHPHVLHLWRHRTREFPMPPTNLVG